MFGRRARQRRSRPASPPRSAEARQPAQPTRKLQQQRCRRASSCPATKGVARREGGAPKRRGRPATEGQGSEGLELESQQQTDTGPPRRSERKKRREKRKDVHSPACMKRKEGKKRGEREQQKARRLPGRRRTPLGLYQESQGRPVSPSRSMPAATTPARQHDAVHARASSLRGLAVSPCGRPDWGSAGRRAATGQRLAAGQQGAKPISVLRGRSHSICCRQIWRAGPGPRRRGSRQHGGDHLWPAQSCDTGSTGPRALLLRAPRSPAL